MESNIFTIIGNRMKGGRAYWSIDGSNNLARLLTLKHTKKLHETLDSLANWVLPAKYAEEVTVKMIPRQIPMQSGKGYEGRHAASFPGTPTYKWLRERGKKRNNFIIINLILHYLYLCVINKIINIKLKILFEVNMKQKINWGILGGANIAEMRFIPALLKSNNSELYAIASRSYDKINLLSKRYPFKKTYTSYEELLNDKDVQAVYIPLPNSMHKEWTIKAAKMGKHVLCEKPISLNAAECSEMIKECKKHDVKLMEAFMYRYSDKIKKIKELLTSGIIGKLKHVTVSFGFKQNRERDYRLDPSLGGGSLYDVGCYAINFINMVTSEVPISVVSEFIVENDIDIASSAILKYKSGVISTFNCWFNAYRRNYSEIIGTEGYIAINDTTLGPTNKIILTTAEGTDEIITEDNDDDKYLYEIEDFADSILNNRMPMMSIDETYRNMKVIDQIMSKFKVSN